MVFENNPNGFVGTPRPNLPPEPVTPIIAPSQEQSSQPIESNQLKDIDSEIRKLTNSMKSAKAESTREVIRNRLAQLQEARNNLISSGTAFYTQPSTEQPQYVNEKGQGISIAPEVAKKQIEEYNLQESKKQSIAVLKELPTGFIESNKVNDVRFNTVEPTSKVFPQYNNVQKVLGIPEELEQQSKANYEKSIGGAFILGSAVTGYAKGFATTLYDFSPLGIKSSFPFLRLKIPVEQTAKSTFQLITNPLESVNAIRESAQENPISFLGETAGGFKGFEVGVKPYVKGFELLKETPYAKALKDNFVGSKEGMISGVPKAYSFERYNVPSAKDIDLSKASGSLYKQDLIRYTNAQVNIEYPQQPSMSSRVNSALFSPSKELDLNEVFRQSRDNVINKDLSRYYTEKPNPQLEQERASLRFEQLREQKNLQYVPKYNPEGKVIKYDLLGVKTYDVNNPSQLGMAGKDYFKFVRKSAGKYPEYNFEMIAKKYTPKIEIINQDFSQGEFDSLKRMRSEYDLTTPKGVTEELYKYPEELNKKIKKPKLIIEIKSPEFVEQPKTQSKPSQVEVTSKEGTVQILEKPLTKQVELSIQEKVSKQESLLESKQKQELLQSQKRSPKLMLQLKQEQKQENKQNSFQLQEPKQLQIQSQASKLESKQKQENKQKLELLQIPKLGQTQEPKQLQIQSPIQKQDLKQVSKQKIEQKYYQEPPLSKSNSQSLYLPKKKSGRFKVEVKKRGKFQTIAYESDLTSALGKLTNNLSNTAAASGKISSEFGGPLSIPIPKGYIQSKRDKNVIVQPRSNRISSFGELQEITFKGIQANRNKKGFRGFKL